MECLITGHEVNVNVCASTHSCLKSVRLRRKISLHLFTGFNEKISLHLFTHFTWAQCNLHLSFQNKMFAKYAPLSMKPSPAQSAKNSPMGSARNSPQVSAKNSPQVSPPGSPQKLPKSSLSPPTEITSAGPGSLTLNQHVPEISDRTTESPFISAKNSPALSLKGSPLHKAKVSPNVSATDNPQVLNY